MKPSGAHTHDSDGGLAVALVIGAVVLAAAAAGPVASAAGELLRAVVIIVAAVLVLAVIAAIAVVVCRLRPARREGIKRTVIRPALTTGSPALPARQEVHVHFHGVSADDAAAILARAAEVKR